MNNYFNKMVGGVVSCLLIAVTISLKMVELTGKSVRPSAVGESAYRYSIGIILCHLVCPMRRENIYALGRVCLERFYCIGSFV